MAKGSVAQTTLRIVGNGLEHRVLSWRADITNDEKPARSAATVVLVHGFMDAAGTWDRVAPELAAHGHRVLALDMRGFGDGARAPRGGYYHFPDYVADLAAIIDAVSPSEPVALVGHSMGGTITTLYAGAFPERALRLANLEGLGPPDNPWEVGPTRMRRWIDGLREVQEPPPLRREDARRRLVTNHPTVSRDILDHRLPHLVRDTMDADGAPRVVWCYDPLHRTTSPMPFFAKLFVEFAKQITCPVLFVSGGAKGYHVPDEEERLAAFARLERVTLEGAGHMMHWTQPDELSARLLTFFASPEQR
jgi:pimeloyl-ACP methyl ester carboxylesterase